MAENQFFAGGFQKDPTHVSLWDKILAGVQDFVWTASGKRARIEEEDRARERYEAGVPPMIKSPGTKPPSKPSLVDNVDTALSDARNEAVDERLGQFMLDLRKGKNYIYNTYTLRDVEKLIEQAKKKGVLSKSFIDGVMYSD